MLSACDANKDGILSAEEVKRVTSMYVVDRGIIDLKGIEYFTALTLLHCNSNQLTALDVSHNTALTYLYCDSNQLTALDVSHNTALTYLECYNNQLTELDVSDCPESIFIYCDDGVTIIRGNAKDKPSITTASLKAGTINKSYSFTLKANGTKPLTWSAEGLPSGLTCSEKGKISGKPTEFGTFNVKFTVSNGASSATKKLQLTIKGIPPENLRLSRKG